MPPNGNVQATIDGDIKGQVAVGNEVSLGVVRVAVALAVADLLHQVRRGVEDHLRRRQAPARLQFS